MELEIDIGACRALLITRFAFTEPPSKYSVFGIATFTTQVPTALMVTCPVVELTTQIAGEVVVE